MHQCLILIYIKTDYFRLNVNAHLLANCPGQIRVPIANYTVNGVIGKFSFFATRVVEEKELNFSQVL